MWREVLQVGHSGKFNFKVSFKGTGAVLTGSCAQTVTDARAAPSVPSSAGRTRIVYIDPAMRITLVKLELPHYYFSTGHHSL